MNAKLIEDVAARWTETALLALKASGVKAVSVSMELETWHVLGELLQSGLGSGVLRMSSRIFVKKILQRTIARVTRKGAPSLDSAAVEERIRRLIQAEKGRQSDEIRPTAALCS